MCNHTGIKSRQPRFDVDGLPIEIFATDQPGEAYVVTEPATHPVGYLFRFEHTSCTRVSITVGSDGDDFRVTRPRHVLVNVAEGSLETVECLFDCHATPNAP